MKKVNFDDFIIDSQDSLGKSDLLKKKKDFDVGKFGRVNFNKKEHLFCLNDKLQDVKAEIKEATDPDILGLKRPKWNTSSSCTPGPRPDNAKHLFNIRVGLADQKISSLTAKRFYPDCDEFRNDYTKWNVSHQIIKREVEMKEKRELENCKKRSLAKANEILEMNAMEGRVYPRLDERVKTMNEKWRKQKQEELPLRRQILESIDKAYSQEKQAALLFRYTEEKKRLDQQLAQKMEEKMFTGKPDMKKTLRSTKKYSYYHPGKWMKPKFESKEMWTCCANEHKESRGCQFRMQDKMAWNYSS
eukprot:TRINITY_DN8012_c0_g1_i3.p1 TRINITY_DN8012_c0_g1~~TRINITY_DN8012_c0_g1_i3.p1  ORF type:complete len:302 (+),score=57.49 TRINITY_DN8012_c0_g1_i3:272-1177(+)